MEIEEEGGGAGNLDMAYGELHQSGFMRWVYVESNRHMAVDRHEHTMPIWPQDMDIFPQDNPQAKQYVRAWRTHCNYCVMVQWYPKRHATLKQNVKKCSG